MSAPIFKTPLAFKQSLEARLRERPEALSQGLSRTRQLLVFDRFLARIMSAFSDRVMLKGGVALELRLRHARTTKDVDLHLNGNPDNGLEELTAALQTNLNDFFIFSVTQDKTHPKLCGDGMVNQGFRFRVQASIAGTIYGEPFGVDVAYHDALSENADVLEGSDALAFIDIPPTKIRIYPRETHIAEKLHAYTMPRPRENTRIRDLPDIALLATTGTFDSEKVSNALHKTFAFRKTHAVPTQLVKPPLSWQKPYARMVLENHLPWPDLSQVFSAARAFVEPVLQGYNGRWNANIWRWE